MSAILDCDPIRAFLEPRHLVLAEELERFVDNELSDMPPPKDDAEARTQARVLVGKLARGRCLEVIDPFDLRACCLVREALGWGSTLADSVFALQALGSTPMLLSGDTDRFGPWLRAIRRGTAIAAFAMTEPEAGSDVSGLSTVALRDGDDYVLQGRKTLITNAGIADVYTVFAATDPAQKHRGISCFVVDAKTPGLRFLGPQELSAPHPLGEIAFEDCRVPGSALVGREGEGFKFGMATLDRLRPTVAAAACGMASRALFEALQHVTTRRQFGQRLADFQLVQAKLASMATELVASRLLVYRAAWARDAGAGRTTVESSMAKLYATETAQRIIDAAVQLCGGQGVLASNIVDQLYRAIRPLRIYEGTSEVQHLVIARHLLAAHEGHGRAAPKHDAGGDSGGN